MKWVWPLVLLLGGCSGQPSIAPGGIVSNNPCIDAILAEMEAGKLPLQELISRYEEGVKLVKLCQAQLQQAEQRIQVVTREAEGVFALKDFQTDNDD